MTTPNSNTDAKGNTNIDINSHIDTLLEHYLSLLDEYTTLRETLNGIQRDIYQGIARANFSAERGIRYGADHYDERMQATRRVEITSKDCSSSGGDGDGKHHGSGFSISVKSSSPPPPSSNEKTEEKDAKNDTEDKPTEHKAKEGDQESENTGELADEKEEKKKKKSNDPIRWFGLLTPLPLRQTQANAIKAVEETIPRMASVKLTMAEVELEVRRARKKRAKAAAAAEKAERAGKAAVAGEGVQGPA